MIEELKRRQALRFTFLRRLYEVSGGSTRGAIQMEEIGSEFGLDRKETGRIVDYLHEERLVDSFAAGGMIKITHAGVVEVEEAIAEPEQPTEHFPSVVIAETYIQAQTISNSQFQIRTTDSQQQIGTVSGEELRELIGDLRRLVSELALSGRMQRWQQPILTRRRRSCAHHGPSTASSAARSNRCSGSRSRQRRRGVTGGCRTARPSGARA